METETTRGIEISVQSFYLDEHSVPEAARFVFAYRVQLHNHSSDTVQLISRHWIVTDSTGEVTEVQGEGVVGEQPTLAPGESYEYTSGSHLKSPMGTMHGTYQMRLPEGETFEAQIPCFTLAVPGVIN
jgi:ApaG protein